jgi:hypothetical protein
LAIENLEPRLCLSAELGYAWATGIGYSDIIAELDRDAAGNFYVSDGSKVIKYSPERTKLWDVRLPDVWNIELDAAGNVYAIGDFFETSLIVPGVAGNLVLPNHGRNDVYAVKLNSSGLALWGHSFGGAEDEVPGSIAVDGQGNLFVAGRFSESATIGNTTLASQGLGDVFIAKIDSAGAFEWGRQIAGSNWTNVESLDVDPAGNLYLTGSYDESVTFLSSENVTLPDVPYWHSFYLAKMAPNGDFVWAHGYVGATNNRLTVDPAGALVMAGRYTNVTDFDPGPGKLVLPEQSVNVATDDLYVLKLTLDGEMTWVKTIGGDASVFASRVAIGLNGQIHIAGSYGGTIDFDPSGNQYFLTSQWTDAFVATLDAAGNFVAARGWGGDKGDSGAGLAVDALGNVYVAGSFHGVAPVDFDPGVGTHWLTSNGDSDGYILKLTPPTGSIASRVWDDDNANGVQDDGELPLVGAVIELYVTPDTTVDNGNDGIVAQAITDAHGDFRVSNLASGHYYLVIRTPNGYSVSPTNVGSDEALDSDVLASARTEVFPLLPGEQKTDQDIGLTGESPATGFAITTGGIASDSGTKVITDSAGNIYVLGQFDETVDFDPGPATLHLTTTSPETYVAKYTPRGALVWSRHLDVISWGTGFDLAVTDAGDVYVTGEFNHTIDIDPDPVARQYLYNTGGLDIFLLKLDARGYFAWGQKLCGTQFDSVAGIEFDSTGNLVIAGTFSKTA